MISKNLSKEARLLRNDILSLTYCIKKKKARVVKFRQDSHLSTGKSVISANRSRWRTTAVDTGLASHSRFVRGAMPFGKKWCSVLCLNAIATIIKVLL